MLAEASGVEAPEWAIRPERPIDLDLIHELHRDAFSGEAEAELVDAIRSSAAFVPELSLVAVTADGSILGHALLSIVTAEVREDDRRDVLALAPVAVLPPHQGRGIGTALVRAALAAADTRPEPLSVVVGCRRSTVASGTCRPPGTGFAARTTRRVTPSRSGRARTASH